MHVRVRTHADQIFDGTLVGGSFVVNDLTISAAQVVSCNLSGDPGRIELRDGTSLTVHQSVSGCLGWALQKRSSGISGSLTVHVMSLGKDVIIQASEIEKMHIEPAK